MEEELLAKELEQIQQNEEISDITEIENLIIDGANIRIPVILEIPVYDKETGELINKKVTAKLKPLTSAEWNNATQLGLKLSESTPDEEIVKKALYTKDDKTFPPKLVGMLYAGVIESLVKQIARISGINMYDEDNIKMAKDMMGF